MSQSELYIGIPNGIVLCVDKAMRKGQFLGRLYHSYREKGTVVESLEEVIHQMRQLFEELQFPRANIRERTFASVQSPVRPFAKRKEKIMSDKELLAKHGDIGTFIIRVQQQQNSTWQGRITWVDENKTMNFRSLLEMIKLIESGIHTEHPELDENDLPTWGD